MIAYFLWCAWFGLRARFAPDDMMNLGLYYRLGPGRMLLSQFAVWENYYRPMGAAFYVPLYTWFGVHPRPFRIVILVLLLVNVYLLYQLARLLGASELASVLAAFIGCFHRAMGELFFNTAFIYDVLCFLFYIGAMVCYVRIRSQNRLPGFAAVLGILALYLCALNSKEIAPTLPILILVYEWIYHRPESLSARALGSWLVRDTRFVWIIVPITLAYVYGKTVGPGALTSIVDYHPEFSIKRVLEFQGGSIADLLCLNWPVGGASIAIFWLVATLLAVVVRQRLVWFCWFWILLSPLPVEFLNRTGPSLYIPLAGWAIFASVVVAWLIDRVSALAVPQVRVAVTAGLVLLIVIPFARMGRDARRYRYKPEMAQQGLLSASVIAQLDALHPAIRPGSRVLFLNDPFHDYDMLFIAQLWANQRDTEFKLNRLEPVPADEQGKYDSIFRFDDGKLVQLK